VHIASALVDK